MLPVGFPGYRPYCPYGLRPSAAGTATAPNLKAAARLVAASGTFGARVQVWAPEDHAAVARYVTKVLQRLGYRASAHVVAGHTSRYYDLIGEEGTRAQVGWSGWIRDFTSPGDFMLPLFTCAGISSNPALTTNYSRVCSAGLDRRIRAADALQQDDPVRAQAAWTAVDRRTVDQALAVPFGSDLDLTLLSQRTGDYQNNPEFGVLLDQLWVH
jgi:peptide/nickel transport system substrate-binding protein